MKSRRHLAITLVLLLSGLIAPPARSADKQPPTNAELIEEESDELEAADKKMNAAYQKLLGILDSDGKAALRQAQRKWLAWRDAQAEFNAHQLKGGKLWQMEVHGSHARATKTRTVQLQEDYRRFKEG